MKWVNAWANKKNSLLLNIRFPINHYILETCVFVIYKYKLSITTNLNSLCFKWFIKYEK